MNTRRTPTKIVKENDVQDENHPKLWKLGKILKVLKVTKFGLWVEAIISQSEVIGILERL